MFQKTKSHTRSRERKSVDKKKNDYVSIKQREELIANFSKNLKLDQWQNYEKNNTKIAPPNLGQKLLNSAQNRSTKLKKTRLYNIHVKKSSAAITQTHSRKPINSSKFQTSSISQDHLDDRFREGSKCQEFNPDPSQHIYKSAI